jgi:hypothetical protein
MADGSGAHARAQALASQDRSVAMPCVGHRCFEPVAQRGGGEVTTVAGRTSGVTGSCNKGGMKAGTGAGVRELS